MEALLVFLHQPVVNSFSPFLDLPDIIGNSFRTMPLLSDLLKKGAKLMWTSAAEEAFLDPR